MTSGESSLCCAMVRSSSIGSPSRASQVAKKTSKAHIAIKHMNNFQHLHCHILSHIISYYHILSSLLIHALLQYTVIHDLVVLSHAVTESTWPMAQAFHRLRYGSGDHIIDPPRPWPGCSGIPFTRSADEEMAFYGCIQG